MLWCPGSAAHLVAVGVVGVGGALGVGNPGIVVGGAFGRRRHRRRRSRGQWVRPLLVVNTVVLRRSRRGRLPGGPLLPLRRRLLRASGLRPPADLTGAGGHAVLVTFPAARLTLKARGRGLSSAARRRSSRRTRRRVGRRPRRRLRIVLEAARGLGLPAGAGPLDRQHRRCRRRRRRDHAHSRAGALHRVVTAPGLRRGGGR